MPLWDKLRMPYLDAVVMETLRILSQGSLGIPRCNREEITVNGYTIPKNSTLFCNMWHIHHDDKQWGDPWTFRPERFLDDQGQPLSATHPVRLKFAAFGLGRRHCPGDSFARARLFMYLVTLLQNFDFCSPPGVSPPPYAPGFIQTAVILQAAIVLCAGDTKEKLDEQTDNGGNAERVNSTLKLIFNLIRVTDYACP
ncbi:hypothetical protein C0Q70_16461 [Pomacea canaliculata]|uniref:Cytochrome P450 n=1 Tax=Pomacea canaliculata TaxID=400727 RepID=A0A2T7NPV3_POMCA|nr:hypothetical protein C0Q70_16461 [Pomacea canaliculata]